MFDKETRRKPLMFAAGAVISRSGLWVLNGVSGKQEQHPVLILMWGSSFRVRERGGPNAGAVELKALLKSRNRSDSEWRHTSGQACVEQVDGL